MSPPAVRLVDYLPEFYLPEFAAELEAALARDGLAELGREFAEAAISRVTHSAAGGACYIYLKPPGPASGADVVEVTHGRTIAVAHPFWVYVDVDSLGRPAGVELLSASVDFVRRLLAYGEDSPRRY
jgi:hypothetical protein